MSAQDDLYSLEELIQMKGHISQLQATLNQVLSRAPSVAKYKELCGVMESPASLPPVLASAPQMVDKLKQTVNTPQIKVAVRIKELCDKGYLPFLLTLAKCNFKSTKLDRHVGYIMHYKPPKDQESLKEEENGHLVGKDIEMYPPSLPPIEDNSLLKLVLTDKSLRQPPDFLESQFHEGHHDFNNNHNRKLAIKGKALLDYLLLEILDDKFIHKAHEDDVVYVKNRLTSTMILAKFAYLYNLTDELQHAVSDELAFEDKLVVFKNVFLAYIQALTMSKYSTAEIKRWLEALYEPMLAKLSREYSDGEILKNVYAVALSEFHFLMTRVNNYFEQPTKKIRYDFNVVESEPFVVTLNIAGEDYSTGTDNTEVGARQKAAYELFQSKTLRFKLMRYLFDNYKKPEPTKPELPKAEAPKPAEPSLAKMIDDDDDYDPEALSSTKDDTPASSQTPTSSQKPDVPSKPEAPPARKPLPYGALPPIPTMKRRAANR
ncbi:uncharacterized protein CXQ87_004520 [Candidozyma duobushaemuli]|uniref:RNase III domain-containing protein n=2 Tax=Candidozyma TaxID=3303203 RepID=A0ABX8ICQ7_9ASCO|nr:uncharacterized protein CXQ87_004520 [[Candida] duobushaemulonis]PVH16962.1 hypothetical protein CXQ87_004520 [[Candida] duobushaemulonis]QWU89735.1 hypothetical protein CA3LBN_004083 [[Candida] haemuloni]